MTLVLETPANQPPISLDEAKAHLHVESNDEDQGIQQLIDAATAKLDGRDGRLGRCLVTQSWKLVLDAFPTEIAVPLPPCQSVESITYLDASGAAQTLDPAKYQVAGIGTPDGARIVVVDGNSWPATKQALEIVTVNFTAGYGDPADVPDPIKTAIKMHVATLYENRESIVIPNGNDPKELPQGALDLVTDFRTWAF